jgi:glyoxylase-like metal-dependent hydrolase (beta-lactamase superfamily II)
LTPSFHKFTVGRVACTVLLDGAAHLGKEGILRRYPDATEDDYRAAFAQVGRSLDDADSAFNLMLIELGSERILIDAGEGGKPKGGWVVESLRLAGMTPDAITQIILTHTHRDHVLGLLTHDVQPVFPNARYVISREELAYWRGRVASGEVDDGAILRMLDAQGVHEIAMDAQIAPGLIAIPLPGHTPGQIGLLLENDGARLLHGADALHQPFQFAHPEWSPTFDLDTSVSVPTRRAFLTQTAASGALTLFYHLTFPGLGYVQQNGTTFTWRPI